MPGVRITCQQPSCINPTNTTATYQHACLTGPKTWTAPAYGPTPDGTPHPSPCPNDGTPSPAISVKCNTCGWTKEYQV